MEEFDYRCLKTTNWEVRYDSTDHFQIFCPHCDRTARVWKVETKKVNIKFRDSVDKCSYVWVECLPCKISGYRKIYWRTILIRGFKR
uniref:Uncharacterized protein n=1 Tax=viral metagenome TaxID=1070528 RepID=A0A6H1ZYR8_9ZZZZ